MSFRLLLPCVRRARLLLPPSPIFLGANVLRILRSVPVRWVRRRCQMEKMRRRFASCKDRWMGNFPLQTGPLFPVRKKGWRRVGRHFLRPSSSFVTGQGGTMRRYKWLPYSQPRGCQDSGLLLFPFAHFRLFLDSSPRNWWLIAALSSEVPTVRIRGRRRRRRRGGAAF